MESENMLILGIESSCDETSVALVEDGRNQLINLVSSQIDLHSKYGGVVPELACRCHMETVNPLLDQALAQAGKEWRHIDAVAATFGPGLVGALLVGVAAAKAISYTLNIPLIGVNHLEGHIYANMLEEGEMHFPSLVLLVSGGHTSIIHVADHGKYEILGETRDDAAGEAFDKVARMLGLGYPGGPVIDRISKEGNPSAVDFPRPMLDQKDNFDFSFSGIKTAAVYYLKSHAGFTASKADIAASFQQAVAEVLVEKTIRAARFTGVRHIMLAGGVGRNSALRNMMTRRCQNAGITAHLPSPEYCTDNAAMIAAAAFFLYERGQISNLELDAKPNLTV